MLRKRRLAGNRPVVKSAAEKIILSVPWIVVAVIVLGMLLLPWEKETFTVAMLLVLMVVALDAVLYTLYWRGLPFRKAALTLSSTHSVFVVAGLLLTGGLSSPFRPLLTVIVAFFAITLPFRWALLTGASIVLSFVLGTLLLFGTARIVELLILAAFDFLTLLLVGALASRNELHRTRFLQIAAHELRNPMAAVKGVCSLVRLQLAAGKPAGEISRTAEMGEREVDRLSALLNEILEAFVVQEGRLALKLERVDLVDVTASAVRPFLLAQGGRRLEIEGANGGAVFVVGDFKRLEEVVRNLVSNAFKYSPDGSGITLTLGVEGKWAVMRVTDSGLGIPREELPDIFEPFHRASNLAGRDPGGMGLGLYICRDIVERHNGRIWAESDEGRGATFHVELPLHA